MKIFQSSIAVLLLLTTTAVSDQPEPSKGASLPRVKSLNGTGFSQIQLDQLTNYLQQQSDTTGMMVLYDGKVAYEYGDVQEVSYIASCRKGVLSMLYGKHVHSGLIDLDESIYAAGRANRLVLEEGISFRDAYRRIGQELFDDED